MPQLDHVTFFSQFFWLCIFFFIYYVALLKGFMPRMSRMLKLRQAKTGSGEVDLLVHEEEQASVNQTYQSVIHQGLTTCKQKMMDRFDNTAKWLANEQSAANAGGLQEANQAYLKTLGSTSLENRLVLAQLDLLLPPMTKSPTLGAKTGLYTSRLVESLKANAKKGSRKLKK